MAIEVTFTPRSMSGEQYDEVIRQLEADGRGAPQARLHHVCFGTGSSLKVVDTWESPEEFGAFAQILRPILQGCGIDLGEPEISPVHNIIPGQASTSNRTEPAPVRA